MPSLQVISNLHLAASMRPKVPGEGEITLYKSPDGEITLYKSPNDEMPLSSKMLRPLVNQTYCKTLHAPEST